MYVTEDTTRADPDTLRQLYQHRDPRRRDARLRRRHGRPRHAGGRGGGGALHRDGASRSAAAGVGIDWHGHRDRDFAIANSLAALEAGATRLHGAAIGIGERVGNTPMDTLLVNLVLMGYIERDLSALVEYCETVSAATGVPIPPTIPWSAATRSGPRPVSTPRR